jgi:3-phosphoshikimate 1-carboxyvinyltransferase
MELRTIHAGTARGELDAPTSKSLTHRALIIAALSAHQTDSPARVLRPLESDDTRLTLRALETMGYPTQRSTDAKTGAETFDWVEFTGKRQTPKTNANGVARIDIHHSGTSARLLAALAAVQPLEELGYAIELDGSERMRRRPMQELIAPLLDLGARAESAHGFLPILFRAGIDSARKQNGSNAAMRLARVDASKSSQFLSALFLVSPLIAGGLRIETSGAIASRSYSDMTLAQMRAAGVKIEETALSDGASAYCIGGGQTYSMPLYEVEGDYSSASYPLAASALTGGEVVVRNLRRDSPQGDRAIIDILRDYGAEVEWLQNGGVRVRGAARRLGVDRDMNACPDIVPTVAVMAMFAETPSIFRNVEHLQYKESDRMSAVIENIARLGGAARREGGALIVEPKPESELRAARLPTFDDHRMAMSFALAGLRLNGVQIEDPACVAKSYPEFWRDFDALTGGAFDAQSKRIKLHNIKH